jgi:glucose/arabinose dehydrogenase
LRCRRQPETLRIEGTQGTELTADRVATFDEPWAMTFLPDGTLLVTEKRGVLWHVSNDGSKTKVQGLWNVAYGGQGGLGDVVLHPDFEGNAWVYLSYAERADDSGTIGAVVVRAKL